MKPTRIFLLTLLSMLAFAANSLLCRAALKSGSIDPASFTAIRLGAGALVLTLVMRQRRNSPTSGLQGGSWPAAVLLFGYAATFSFAYVRLPAGVGALLLFGAVQVTMIATGLVRGERLASGQWAGMAIAMGGLLLLLLPGLTAPPLDSALLMLAAGVGWGAYSLFGKSARDASAATAGNFLRAVPLAAVLLLAMHAHLSVSGMGLFYALCSGAVTSALGYIVWYSVLPKLRASVAATVQLSVPLLAALGGVLLLGEGWTARLAWSAAAMLGGIALVVLARKRA